MMRACLAAAIVLLSACAEAPEDVAQGYIEGDFLFIAAEESGRILSLPAAEGARVSAGGLLFRLEAERESAALAAATARAEQAAEELADLERGARPQRLKVLNAGIARAQADLALARRRLERRRVLAAGPAVSPETLDEAEAAFQIAQARLAEAREQRALERLPARAARIAAARAGVRAARAETEAQEAVLARHRVTAPADGTVQEVLRRPGELAPAGAPVISFLPADARRAVFFISQSQLTQVDIDMAVSIACDGCPDGLTAPIRFIADAVEFTPPVIFGPAERKRLLIRVEAAIPSDHAPALKPGQPITVTLPLSRAGGGWNVR